MTNNPLSRLAKLALGVSKETSAPDALVEAMRLVRMQTGAVSAFLFYEDRGNLAQSGDGDHPITITSEAIGQLSKRMARFRVPLAFNIQAKEVQFVTRATTKQRRDHMSWLVPTADRSIEILILRGSWPPSAISPLLEFMESAMPAITILVERVVGVGRTDALTGLLNHRGAIESIQIEIDRRSSEPDPMSLVLGDIDRFKLFNDTYGHVSGDEVLKVVATVLREVAAPPAIPCRYGGDEFLIILPHKDRSGAMRMARRIGDRLGRANFRPDHGTPVPLRMSMGVASFPKDAETSSKLVAVADAAMYSAKSQLEAATQTKIATRKDTTYGVLESLVLAVDAKDRYTMDHCDIVAEYAVLLADRLNLSSQLRRALRVAGLLHDIGKVAVPDRILKKPGPLTEDEYEIMKRHVRIGEVMIREVPQLKDVIQAVSCHHERFDGNGYPRGLKGQGIPLLGRIIAIADAYSAMSLDRPYRKALSPGEVLAELEAGAGTQFDPELLKPFLELLVDDGMEKLRPAA